MSKQSVNPAARRLGQPGLELDKTLQTLRQTLAQKRAARKTQTDQHLHAFQAVSSALAQSENRLLEQVFRAYAVLDRLKALEQERSNSEFSSSFPPAQAASESERTAPSWSLPGASELAAFQHALRLG